MTHAVDALCDRLGGDKLFTFVIRGHQADPQVEHEVVRLVSQLGTAVERGERPYGKHTLGKSVADISTSEDLVRRYCDIAEWTFIRMKPTTYFVPEQNDFHTNLVMMLTSCREGDILVVLTEQRKAEAEQLAREWNKNVTVKIQSLDSV